MCLGVPLVPLGVPRLDLFDEGGLGRDTAPKALTTQKAEFDLRHVEPTTVFGGITELEFICDSFRLRRIKGFIKRCFGVRIEIELVASFRNLSKFLKSWEKTDGRPVCAVEAYGPNNMAIRRIPGPHSATNSPAIF